MVDPAPLDLRVLNSADFFLHVRAKVISGPSGMSGTLDLQVVGNIQPYKVCPSIPPKWPETLMFLNILRKWVILKMIFRYFFQWDNFIVRMVITCEPEMEFLALTVVLSAALQQLAP